ncbi:uncharacterized protein [Amphiura filiformis]|uniref:uncharacterized protein n=1 Tax=Amphiura filiformis TaxID=82378 RepID=UPI003B2175A6
MAVECSFRSTNEKANRLHYGYFRTLIILLLYADLSQSEQLFQPGDAMFLLDFENVGDNPTTGGKWVGPPVNLCRYPTTGIPFGIDYNPFDGKMYWTEVGYPGSTIKRAGISNTNVETLVSDDDPGADLVYPAELVIDVEKTVMYWVHNDINREGPSYADRERYVTVIEKSNWDGSGRTQIITPSHGMKYTYGMAFDPYDRYLFWTDSYGGKIEKMDVDIGESSVETLLIRGREMNGYLSGIEIDFAEQKLYFSDFFRDTVESIKFDGTGLNTFYEAPVGRQASILGVGIYGNDVYWGNWEWTTLFRKNKFDGLPPEAVEVAPGAELQRPFIITFYQDDPEDIRCKPCCGSEYPLAGTVLRVSPSFGSMLGGDILTFSGIGGSCSSSQPSTNPQCRFDGTEVVQGENDGNNVLCVSPTFFKTGRILVEISVDGSGTYEFQAYFTAVSVEQIDTTVTRDLGGNIEWTSKENNKITWDDNGKFSGRVENVNVSIYGYSETSTDVALTEIWTYATTVSFLPGELTFSILPSMLTSGITSPRVGIIKVYDSNPVSLLNPAALWSDVHSLNWLFPPSSTWCVARRSGWISIEANLGGSEFLMNTPACPCDLNQALVDFGRYHPHPECNMADNNCAGLYADAVHCVRATMPSASGGGQECCYDSNNNIINLNDPVLTTGGGFAHRNHHAGVAPYNSPQTVPYLSHFLNDLEPRLQCCVFHATNCQSYEDLRPSSTDCSSYVAPTPGVGGGDPHFLTMDGKSYTFNGKGEYWMMKTDPGSGMDNVILQARTNTLPNTDFPVTVFVAVVAQYGSSDIVHVELNSRRLLDVWVREQGQEDWNRLNLEENNWWSLKGVSISSPNIAESGVIVLFDGGVSLQLRTTTGANRVMSLLFLGPESFKGHTEGLFGTWNDNPDDDFLTPSGTIVDSDYSTEDIHSQFGQTWQIEASDSLFYYALPNGPDSYKDEAFVPVFSPPTNPNVLPDDVIAACDGNEWCIFDFQATGDMEVALASKASFEEQDIIIEASMGVVICSSLVAPTNGGFYFTRTSVGGMVTYMCDEGFMLMGMETRVCQQTGQWFGRVPSCLEIPVIGPSMFVLDKSVHLVLENENSIIVTIRRTGDTRVAGSVRLATESTSAGKASSATDFQAHTELLYFDEGVEEIPRFIYIKDDDVKEDLESFEIRLFDAVNSDIGMPDMATVFIEDDEVEHFFREIAYSVSENTASVQLTVQKVGYMGRTEVNFLTMDGSAKSPEDYISRRGTVVFEQDFNTAYIEISIRNDDTYEESEQFSVVLQSSTPEHVGSRDEAVVNIESDDKLCSVPCENGGECTDVDTCTCSSPAFYGRYCEKDSCTPPCENGGKCTAFSTCDCAKGYQGNRCQLPVCTPSCNNGGTCIAPNTCSCTPNYTGTTCTQTVCSPPCLNRGVCNELHKCTCPFIFTGDRCELLATNDCLTPNLCGSEEFRCIETMASYMCRCAFGYFTTGDQCLLASRVIIAEMSILEIEQMPILYEDTLMYPGSRRFATLEDTLIRVLSNILRFGVTGFLEVKIRAIRMGSIRVEFEVLLNEQTTSGSQDVLDAIQRSTTPRGILAGTNIKVDPFFTVIITELCPADYCQENMECRPEPINSVSVCVCDDDVSENECSEIRAGGKDKDDDDFSVAGIIGLGIVLIVLLVAIPVGLLFCHRVRRSRQLNAQRVNMASAYANQPNQLPNVYWNAQTSQAYVHTLAPQNTGTDYWGLNSWANYI